MGRIVYKTASELEKMRAAGQVVSEALAAMRAAVRPGITTGELDRLAAEIIRRHGGKASFLGYQGFPASICASLNEEVVHGIPGDRVLQEGDLVKLDIGVRLKGYHADSALTVPVGEISEEHRRLLEVTREALWRGIQMMRPRARLQDVARAIQEHVEPAGFHIVRDMVGHGIGRQLHEPPQVPNYVDPRQENPLLAEGMVLAIEPMVNCGTPEIETLEDGWTVVTGDRRASAHFEHTVAVTRNGYAVLTLGPHDPGP